MAEPRERLVTVTVAFGNFGVKLADQASPRITRGLDVRTLPLSPEEAFVLSRVDGSSPPKDIAASTGLPDERVNACLERLRALGAISFGPEQDTPRSPVAPTQHSPSPVSGAGSDPQRTTSGVRPTVAEAARAARRPTPAGHPRAAIEENAFVPPRHSGARDYDVSLLDEPADLDVERKRIILEAYAALGRVSHYQLLGVPEDADKKAIKLAYYERVAIFHTDRYYGKSLGIFKPRLEKVFGALTKAYDTLTRNKSRQEYDRSLAASRHAPPLDSVPPRRMTPTPAASGATPSAPPVRNVEAAVPVGTIPPVSAGEEGPTHPYIPGPPRPPTHAHPFQAQARPILPPEPAPLSPASHTSSALGAAPAGTVRESLPPAGQPRVGDSVPATGARFSSLPPQDPEAAKRSLARKLVGARSSLPSPGPLDAARRSVSDELKNLYEKRVAEGQDGAPDRYRALAEQAISEGNLPSAINALKVALSLAPEDKSLRQLLEQTEEQNDAVLADQFLEQARYEEQEGRPAEAARSYGRAARGKKSAQLYDRAALCLVEAGIEARQAVEYARKASAIDPKRAVYRLTLARAYYLSNMPTSASAEMKRALELAPDHDEIRAWAKRLR